MFGHGFGQDWIVDFNPAEGDRIVAPAGLAYSVSQFMGQTVLDFGGGDLLGLAGVSGFDPGWLVAA